ncbi:hypothetical protein P691DRAFT_759078 [Macrolepiota fuliginosa MF-IS2]|uniref:Uncharacterized protein n=1 Tax=Macrolepiota fuliginosa MF-IS2 TaxID=1400762 RepID=A0A9P5XGK3_9AGAR|nr:hypothetical protein P691DRAFT_759078 [Macrolepiota fuliginosa MF-IS2]
MRFTAIALTALAFLVSQAAASPEPQGNLPAKCGPKNPCKSSPPCIIGLLTNPSDQAPPASSAATPKASPRPPHLAISDGLSPPIISPLLKLKQPTTTNLTMRFTAIALTALALLVSQTAASPEPQGNLPTSCGPKNVRDFLFEFRVLQQS